jgi:hypothetical protein
MRRLPLVLFLAVTATGCSLHDPPPSNVKPPRPGVPAAITDVTGIYRSIHQGLLQLRGDGQFVLVVPEGPGPSSGSYTVSNGRLSVSTKGCGATTGEYDLVVSGVQEAGKAVLNIAAVDDNCEDRRHYLTADPWIYANS